MWKGSRALPARSLFSTASAPGAEEPPRPRFSWSISEADVSGMLLASIGRGLRERPGHLSLWASGRDSSSSSPGAGEPAPEVVTPVPSPPSLLPHSSRRAAVLSPCRSLRIHNMAHFRKADFDQGIGTNTVAADTEEKQTVPCAGSRGRGASRQSRALRAAGRRAAALRPCCWRPW